MTSEVHALVDQLLALDDRITELMGGSADSVTDSRGRTMLLRRTQDELRLVDATRQSAILDALPAQVALLDEDGRLVCVNKAWVESLTTGPATAPNLLGQDFVAACEAGPPAFREAASGIRAVLEGTLPDYQTEYQSGSGDDARWFSMRVMPVEAGGAVAMHLDITDRRRIARKLALLSLETERRERMLNSMLASTSDLTYAVDRQCRVLWANEPMLRAWGMPLEQARGRTTIELGYSADQAYKVARQIDEVFQHGRPVRDEMAYLSSDGFPGHYEYIFDAALAPDGSVEFVVGCSREITARKRAQEALLESVAEFRTLASAMPQIVWSSAPDGELFYLNQRWIEYVGMSLADSLGWGWLAAVHADDRGMVRRKFQQALARQEVFSLELRLCGAQGDGRWWLLRAVPVQDHGRVVKWIGTCTDVDELKAAQDEILRANIALQQQRSELRTLFDVVPAMVWLKDADGRIMQLNNRAASLSGLSVEEACGRPMSELFPAEAASYVREDREIIATGQPLLGKVEQVFDVDGRMYWVQSDKVPCHGPDGSVVGVMVMKHDITERTQAQQALRELNESLEVRVRERTAELALARDEAERANRAKSAFLATMSHEIRTPMSGLLGLLELLDLSWLDNEQRSTLRVARESGQALKNIIDGTLDFSKIEANSLELAAVPSSLRAVIEGVGRLHAPVASGKDVLLTTQVDPEISAVLQFDPLRLGQILNNFVSNAIKFTERGSITVRAELLHRTAGKEYLRVVVRDTGIGIASDRLDRLFQPFVQAESQTASQYGGTGLGLFIARRLADLMGGTVTMSSQLGAGTALTLMVAFDVSAEGSTPEDFSDSIRSELNDLVAARPPPPTLQEAQAEGTLLLVVDDHPINRMVLMRQVAALGYAAESAVDGQHALKAWDSGRFGAVVTDCNMPRMNGFELTRAIRSREAERNLPRTPIIGCTANALVEAASNCLDAGMDDSVTKPVALEDICALLDRWVPLPSVRTAAQFADAPVRPTARPAPAAASERLLDLALLQTLAGGDPAVLAGLLADFRRCNAEDAAGLRRAARREDFAQVLHFAHRLRGACAMVGASLLADASASVQESAASHSAGDVHATMQEFEMELLRLNNYLDTIP